jgi:cytochrome c oxidase cbb3-type subunit 3
MQSYSASLGDQGIEDVVAYLRSLSTEVAETRPTLPPPLPLGPVLHPKGPSPTGFVAYPAMTKVDIVGAQYARKARMMLLDARVPSDYEQDHIRGAVSVPFYDPTPYISKLPKNTWLVCYCGCPHAESGQLAQKLQAAGFSQVTVLDEGLWDWKQKGHPMNQGRKP